MTEPINGTIYHGTAEARYTPAPVSQVREALILLLSTEVWDSQHEKANKALLEVLDWHKPWMHWEQVYEPTYLGDRFIGVGCRSCNWISERDCPTVTAIARIYGVI